jgi:F-type H+-transporting ATPase subunit delta
VRATTIARNYAEALFDLGERSGSTGRYAELIDAIAGAVETTPEVQAVLMSPRVPKAKKVRLLATALKDAPREFVLFIQAVVKRSRQRLLREIATEYQALLDIKHNRVRAGITLAQQADPSLQRDIQAALSRQLGKEVLATFHVDPEILGGTVVRVGERIHDGSVRRRVTKLRRHLISG